MKLIYSETNKMPFDKETVLGAKSTTAWGEMLPDENKADKPTPFAEKVFGKTNSMDNMFCTGLLDIFGMDKTNELLAAAPVTHDFYLNDDGICEGRFAEEIMKHILENSNEEEQTRVTLVYNACKATFLGGICEMLEEHVINDNKNNNFVNA